MDGILPQLPWTATRTSLRVPYLACPLYQPRIRSFDDFPAYNGFPQTDAGDLVRVCKTIGSLTTFLQSWLFFEFISAFLEHEIDRDDFATGGLIDLDKEAAHEYFREWQKRLARLSSPQKRLAQERLKALIERASLKSETFEEAAGYFGAYDDCFDRVALSVKLLTNLLSAISDDILSIAGRSRLWADWVSALASRVKRWATPSCVKSYREFLHDSLMVMEDEDVRRHLRSQRYSFRPFPPGVDRGGRAAERLHRHFVDNGWCPYRALQLCRSYDYLTLNSLASLVNDPALVGDHGQCLELQRCCAHNLVVDRPDEYPFQHAVDEHHDCEFVHAPREQITEIIKSGGIPIISVSLENDLDLQIVRHTPFKTYTAISHVWSDGLGNPRSNALPRCQLLRLRRMIIDSYSSEHSPFYNDSTIGSRFRTVLYWDFWKIARKGKPYFKFDKKRVYFWMDTLCIPVPVESWPEEDNKELKFRAMKHITPVFVGAFNTLVLDKKLQTVSVPDSSQVSGDEFAAFILSSKWMQRGWTLEEGALSSSCTFQMMGKPYEISMSLNRLLPKAKMHHSPLERASINTRRLMPEILKRALLDDKKALPHQSVWRRSRLEKLLRIPQFVWTWNSLLERSVTKLYDGPIILANLLDFNVFALKFVPDEDRLKLLIQSCDELPLSLLYNTGPRVSIRGQPELGWIPRSIAGDHLIVGAALRRINTKGNDDQVKFYIDRSDSDPESLLILETFPTQFIPYDMEAFVVRAQAGRGDDVQQEYVIEIQRPPMDEDSQLVARRIYEQSQGTCVLIDLASGTLSRRGFAGKGVRFYVDSQTRNGKVLKYDAPLIAWTPDQWQYKYGRPPTAITRFEMARVGRRQLLLLKYDASLWGERLVRRPIFIHFSFVVVMAVLIASIVAIRLGGICGGYFFTPIRRVLGIYFASMVFFLFLLVLTAFVFKTVRERVTMHKYALWLKTFEDDYMQAPRRRNIFRRFAGMCADRALSIWRRRRPRGVTQVSISLSLFRDRENSRAAELPGEIFLP